MATLRADYLPALFAVPPLFAVAKRDGIELRAMSPTELSQAIRRPLGEVNRSLKIQRSWQPALVERLIEDVGSDAALLPLLQVTLTSLWNDPPRRLTLDRYRNLTAALESTAERVYMTDGLGRARSAAERQTIIEIFLDLVEVSLDDDARRDVRRTVPKVDLLRDHPERAPLLDALVSARLLSASADHGDATIDIIHETLLANWSRLRDAIADRREALQGRERFRVALHEWFEHEQSDDYLIQGVRLAEARELASRRDIAVSDANARAFLERSAAVEQEAQQRELQQARALAAEQKARAEESQRAARRLRLGLIAVATAAVLAIVAAAAAVNLLITVDRQAKIESSRALAAQSSASLITDPELSVLLARQAELVSPTQEAADALRMALASSPIRVELHGTGSAMGPIAMAPDGKTFAAADADGGVHVAETLSGHYLAEFQAHTGPIVGLAYSADGSRLLSASASDPAARVWDAHSGAPIGELRVSPAATISAVAFSHDGRWIALGSSDGAALVDASSLTVVAPLAGRGTPVSVLAFSPDDSRLLAASLDGSARVWTVDTSPSSVDLFSNRAPVIAASFDRAGRRLVTVGTDGVAGLWDAANGAPGGVLTTRGVGFVPATGDSITSAAFSPDGTRVVTGRAGGIARVWDATSDQLISDLHGHTGQVSIVSYNSEGSRILSASYDGTARVWNADDPTDSLVLSGHTRELTDAHFSPDGQTVVTSSLDGTVRIWSVNRTQPWTTLRGHSRKVYSVAFSPDGRRLASGGIDTTLRLWNLTTGGAGVPPFPTVISPSQPVTSVAFSTDGRLGFGRDDGSVGMSPSDDAVMELRGHRGGVHTVAFSADGARVLTASADGTARIWNATSGEQLGQLEGHDVTSAEFDSVNRRIATSDSDGTIRVWDASSFVPLVTVRAPGIVYHVEFSPDGRYVVSGSDDRTIRIWQADNGQLVKELISPAGPVYGVAFSQDGKLLVSVGAEHHAMIWDTATWQSMTELPGETGNLLHVAFSANGQQLATAGDDGLIRVYPRELFAPVDELKTLVQSRVTRQLSAVNSSGGINR